MRCLPDEGEFVGIVITIFLSFGLLYHLISPAVFLISATAGISAAVVGLVPLFLTKARTTYFKLAVITLLLLFAVPLGYAGLRLDWSLLSPISVILLVALTFIFFFYSVFLPLALLHVRWSDQTVEPTHPYPTVSIIVPAYNEESCIGASIRALQQTDYPAQKMEILVVDDGSTDDTYEAATKQADETVTILQKQNGGKYTALNHGLEHATGEIIVTVDADSLLEENTLNTIVGNFQQDQSLGAIAGNLTVANQHSPLTKLQELEYIVGIQLFRRAYDAVNTVIVVPGAFGAYRRDVLDRVGGFDGDTLTEDRDATVQILRAGSGTRASEALCRTEAPESISGLYKQRLRWYRGTVQTLLKHRAVFRKSEYGYLYSLAFPMEAFSVMAVPIIGIVVVLSIVLEVLLGSVVLVLSLFAFFTLLQTLVSVLALRIGDNDLTLVAYAPLFVLGYRQFLDVVMLKSVLDVLLSRDLEWTQPERTGRLGAILESTRKSQQQPSHPEEGD